MARKRVRKNYYKNSRARRRQQIIRRWLLGLRMMVLAGGMAATSLLLILAYDAVTQTSYFEAQKITIEGNKELSKGTVLKHAGMRLRDNILAVNLNAIRYRLIAHPWIADADVERELPDTIHIRVQERIPLAIVELDRPAGGAGGSVAGGLFYLDEKGSIFKPVEPSDKARVPVVTGLSLADIDFDNPGHSSLFKTVMEALHLSRLQKDLLPSYALHRIQVDREMGLTLHASLAPHNLYASPVYAPIPASSATREMRAGGGVVAIKVSFGGYESKFSRLRYLVSYLKQEDGSLNIQFIDMSDSDRVVVKPLPTGQDKGRSVAEGGDCWSSKRKEV